MLRIADVTAAPPELCPGNGAQTVKFCKTDSFAFLARARDRSISPAGACASRIVVSRVA